MSRSKTALVSGSWVTVRGTEPAAYCGRIAAVEAAGASPTESPGREAPRHELARRAAGTASCVEARETSYGRATAVCGSVVGSWEVRAPASCYALREGERGRSSARREARKRS